MDKTIVIETSNKDMQNTLMDLGKKENALVQILAWLKGKDYYEEMNKDLQLFEKEGTLNG